jgi:ribosome-binding factor A
MSHRIERINHLIRQEISELLQRQAKDPRLSNFISVTEVNTSGDLKYARVFISYMGTDTERKQIMTTIQQASGYFRSELARRLNIRRVPEISFHWDESIQYGAHIEELIDQVSREHKTP